MTIREKLNLMREIEERNRQHVKDWKRESSGQEEPSKQKPLKAS